MVSLLEQGLGIELGLDNYELLGHLPNTFKGAFCLYLNLEYPILKYLGLS